MRRCRNDRQAVLGRHFRYRPSQVHQLFACLLQTVADSCTDFDLRLKELWGNLPPNESFNLGQHAGRRFADEAAGFQLDDLVFLLDTDGKTGFSNHGYNLLLVLCLSLKLRQCFDHLLHFPHAVVQVRTQPQMIAPYKGTGDVMLFV